MPKLTCVYKIADHTGYQFFPHGVTAKWIVHIPKTRWNEAADVPVCGIHIKQYKGRKEVTITPIEEKTNG